MDAYSSTKPVSRWAAKYPRRVAWLRVAIGIWLLCLMTILYELGHGGQWAWLLAVGAAVHFGLAYRRFQITRTGSDASARFH
jgi:hypothetical protein